MLAAAGVAGVDYSHTVHVSLLREGQNSTFRPNGALPVGTVLRAGAHIVGADARVAGLDGSTIWEVVGAVPGYSDRYRARLLGDTEDFGEEALSLHRCVYAAFEGDGYTALSPRPSLRVDYQGEFDSSGAFVPGEFSVSARPCPVGLSWIVRDEASGADIGRLRGRIYRESDGSAVLASDPYGVGAWAWRLQDLSGVGEALRDRMLRRLSESKINDYPSGVVYGDCLEDDVRRVLVGIATRWSGRHRFASVLAEAGGHLTVDGAVDTGYPHDDRYSAYAARRAWDDSSIVRNVRYIDGLVS